MNKQLAKSVNKQFGAPKKIQQFRTIIEKIKTQICNSTNEQLKAFESPEEITQTILNKKQKFINYTKLILLQLFSAAANMKDVLNIDINNIKITTYNSSFKFISENVEWCSNNIVTVTDLSLVNTPLVNQIVDIYNKVTITSFFGKIIGAGQSSLITIKDLDLDTNDSIDFFKQTCNGKTISGIISLTPSQNPQFLLTFPEKAGAICTTKQFTKQLICVFFMFVLILASIFAGINAYNISSNSLQNSSYNTTTSMNLFKTTSGDTRVQSVSKTSLNPVLAYLIKSPITEETLANSYTNVISCSQQDYEISFNAFQSIKANKIYPKLTSAQNAILLDIMLVFTQTLSDENNRLTYQNKLLQDNSKTISVSKQNKTSCDDVSFSYLPPNYLTDNTTLTQLQEFYTTTQEAAKSHDSPRIIEIISVTEKMNEKEIQNIFTFLYKFFLSLLNKVNTF